MSELNPKIILFDFDGTLADSFEISMEIVHKVSKKHKLNLSRDEIYEISKSIPIKNLLKKFKINKIKLLLFYLEIKKELKKVLLQIKPFKDVEETLIELKNRNYELGIVSSSSKRNIKKFLKKYNLEKYFKFIISKKSLTGKYKVFNSILKKEKLEKNELIYIGDEVRDLESANKSQIDCIILTKGFNSFNLIKKYNPEYFTNKFFNILDLIK